MKSITINISTILVVLGLATPSYAYFGSYKDVGNYRIWTFRFTEREAKDMTTSLRNCGPIAAGIINEVNDLSKSEWGIKLGSLSAKTILTFKLHSIAKDVNGYPFAIELRVVNNPKIKQTLEYFDQLQGYWRKFVSDKY